jgi:ABC-2 type transport system permease protein
MRRINNFFHELRLVVLLFRYGTKDISESLAKIFADLMTSAMRLGIVVWLYSYLFMYKGEEIMGVNLQIVAWSMFVYFVFMFINPRYLSTDIQKDIQSGRVEVLLSKPVSYIGYKLGEFLGSRFFTFFVSSLVGLFFMVVLLGVPENFSTLFSLLTFVITFVFCLVLSFEIYVILGLLSFWIEDVNPVRWIVDKLTMILGGAYFPVVFFPDFLKHLSLYTPIGASQFLTYTVYPNWADMYIKMFLTQIFWIFVLGLVLYLLQKKAFQKLSVNGG